VKHKLAYAECVTRGSSGKALMGRNEEADWEGRGQMTLCNTQWMQKKVWWS